MKNYSKEADECYTLVSEIVDTDFTLENLVLFVTKTMEVVENLDIDELSGGQKKQMVIAIINKFIKKSSIADDTKLMLSTSVQLMVPNLIDSIIAASDGLIDVNQIKQAKVCSICFP